jgi:hypothetical protein
MIKKRPVPTRWNGALPPFFKRPHHLGAPFHTMRFNRLNLPIAMAAKHVLKLVEVDHKRSFKGFSYFVLSVFS